MLAISLQVTETTSYFHQVAWTEHHGSGKNRRTVHYRNHETYLNIKLYLIGDGKEKSKLQAGAHSFPFSITLPMNLPSTFMGAHGKLGPVFLELFHFVSNFT